ncbi:hypothetical protein Patl1_34494 [Pistacia atlantica]|uniref:Uncharacterized protein n=1 Tax=Pistacia atlantica TaxID=434234 RepID=A0ACC0ZVI7_9ROSI|nr:hypothetical protein Patl1_34494 [Pistacia atlantica]
MGSQPYAPETWCTWLVPLIFLVCIFMFGYTMYVNDCPETTGPENCILYHPLGRFSFQPLTENHLFGPSIHMLKLMGGLDRKLVVDDGDSWRLFSCIWLHAGVVHLLVNMLSLLLTGIRLEGEFGFLRIGPLYVLSGFGGSLLSCLCQETGKETISVGASGALFGLLGAMLSDLITNWTIYTRKCVAFALLGIVIALNLAAGFIPGVDNSAHMGGFISGFLLGFIFLLRPQYGYVSSKYIAAGYDIKQRKPKYKFYQKLLWVAALVAFVIG